MKFLHLIDQSVYDCLLLESVKNTLKKKTIRDLSVSIKIDHDSHTNIAHWFIHSNSTDSHKQWEKVNPTIKNVPKPLCLLLFSNLEQCVTNVDPELKFNLMLYWTWTYSLSVFCSNLSRCNLKISMQNFSKETVSFFLITLVKILCSNFSRNKGHNWW